MTTTIVDHFHFKSKSIILSVLFFLITLVGYYCMVLSSSYFIIITPLRSHSHYRYPTGGTRSTTGSSTAGDSTGYVATVPEELLRPLIPNQQSPQMHASVAPSSTASSSLYRVNQYNR